MLPDWQLTTWTKLLRVNKSSYMEWDLLSPSSLLPPTNIHILPKATSRNTATNSWNKNLVGFPLEPTEKTECLWIRQRSAEHFKCYNGRWGSELSTEATTNQNSNGIKGSGCKTSRNNTKIQLSHNIISQGINAETRNHIALSVTGRIASCNPVPQAWALSELLNSTDHWSFWFQKSLNWPWISLFFTLSESFQTKGETDPLKCYILLFSLKHLTVIFLEQLATRKWLKIWAK